MRPLASGDVKPRTNNSRTASNIRFRQHVMRLAGVLLAFIAMVNLLNIARTFGARTAEDELQVDRRSERRREDDELTITTEDKWAALMEAADAAAGSQDQQPPVVKIHYTAKSQAPATESEWRAINGADVEIHYYSDELSEALVRERRPEFLETYQRKLSPVERADYFRYLVLWAHGGVYVDSDITFVTPVDKWLATFGWDVHMNGRTQRHLQSLDAVVGVEFPSPQSQYKHIGWLPLQFTQFVIAGAKGSELLKSVVLYIEECVDKIDRGDNVETTIERTGPAAFTRAILNAIHTGGIVAPSVVEMHKNHSSDTRYPRALIPVVELEKTGQLILWRRPRSDDVSTPYGADAIGSILVLPYRAFAYHQFHGIAEAPVLTRHFYHNSWRDNN